MNRAIKKVVALFICGALMLSTAALSAIAAPSDYTVTVAADSESAKIGDVVTVSVSVSGANFCAAQMELSYDAKSFKYVSTMPGWSDNGDGKLAFFDANTKDDFWSDGKVIGTFKFLVTKDASEGEKTFCIGEDSDVIIVGDASEGANSGAVTALDKSQFVSATVSLVNDGSVTEVPSNYGVISDDGNVLNMEMGHCVYSIVDADDAGKIIWKSDNESVATVDENGLVTAIGDGSTVITATDENGNEIEKRTLVVGTIPANQEESEKSTDLFLWIGIAAVILIAVIVAVVIIRKKRSKAE